MLNAQKHPRLLSTNKGSGNVCFIWGVGGGSELLLLFLLYTCVSACGYVHMCMYPRRPQGPDALELNPKLRPSIEQEDS